MKQSYKNLAERLAMELSLTNTYLSKYSKTASQKEYVHKLVIKNRDLLNQIRQETGLRIGLTDLRIKVKKEK